MQRNNPDKGLSLAQLVKKYGPDFKIVTEKEQYFDPTAKPKNPKKKPSLAPTEK